MTKKLEKKLPPIGSQEHVADPIVVAKFFYPAGCQTWLAIEYLPTRRLFFGYVSLFNDHNNEFGYFSLDELESFRGSTPVELIDAETGKSTRISVHKLGIERDMHFTPAPLSEVKAREHIV